MKTRPTLTPIDEVNRVNKSFSPGTLDGRIGAARLIKPDSYSSVDSESIDDEGEEESLLFWQDQFVCQSSGTQQFNLSHLPLENSEHVYWGTVYQRGSFWKRPEGSTSLTLLDPYNQTKTGDTITVEYAYDPNVVGLSSDYVALVLSHGPIFYAKLDETSGSFIRDISGFDRHGSIDGSVVFDQPTMSSGLPGPAMHFAGAGRVIVPAATWQNPNQSTGFSAECWWHKTDASQSYIFCKDDAGAYDADRSWLMTASGYSGVSSHVFYSSGNQPPDGAQDAPPASDIPIHHVLVYTGSSVKNYLNGQLMRTSSATNPPSTSLVFDMTIGSSDNGSFGYYANHIGRIQHATLWDRPITDAEILSHYRVGSGQE